MAIPTLYIGLGGTGMEVLLRLRRAILNKEWGTGPDRRRIDSLNEFPFAKFLYFDIALGEMIMSGRALEEKALYDLSKFTDEERIVECFDIDKYFRDDESLWHFPHIQGWCPLTTKKFRDLTIDRKQFAGMIRAFSRLYFFDKYIRTRDQIRLKLKDLQNGLSKADQLKRLGLEQAQEKFKIVVVCSAAGGTGSGSFIDMGWLAGWLGKELPSVDTELVLFMPSGFRSAGKDRTEANGYAALMELETVMRGGAAKQYLTRWDAYENPTLNQKPYDEVYLVDSGNVAKQQTGDIKDMYQMVADALFENLSPSGDLVLMKRIWFVNSRRFNHTPFSPPADTRFGCMKLNFYKGYAAFGHASLDIPEVSRACDAPSNEHSNLLFEALSGLSQADRLGRFKSLLERAMPWIETEHLEEFVTHPYQFKCWIGVAGAEEFSQRYAEEIQGTFPEQAGITASRITFAETDEPGRVTCYCELSGVPLTVLSGLSTWRESYDKENDKIPLHTHIDATQFVHPIVPGPAELNQLADDFKQFLLAVMLGVVKRSPRSAVPPGQYRFTVRPGERFQIGNERSVRKDGLPATWREQIINRVNDQLSDLGRTQLGALAALAGYFAFHVYRPGRVTDANGMDAELVSFAHVVASELERDLTELARSKGLSEQEHSKLEHRALADLSIWTAPIEGSDKDAYDWEVALPDEESGPRLKLVVRKELFMEGEDATLASLLNPSRFADQPAPSVNVYFLGIDGRQTGPYDITQVNAQIVKGQIDLCTLVWKPGLPGWLQISQLPELGGAQQAKDGPPPLWPIG